MIKVSELAAKVKEIGEANPDVIYANLYREAHPDACGVVCVYQFNGQPGCIVGRAMLELGLDLDIVAGFDGATAGMSQSIDGIVLDNPDVFEKDNATARYFLGNAQARQDGGSTWGEAIAP